MYVTRLLSFNEYAVTDCYRFSSTRWLVTQMSANDSIEKRLFDTPDSNFHIKRTFTFLINLLLTLLNWQWPTVKIWSAYACHQLKRALFVVNEVYPRNAEPLPFCSVNHYNASFIFQFALERFECPSKRSRFFFWGRRKIFRFRNPRPRSQVVIRITMICNEIVIVEGQKTRPCRTSWEQFSPFPLFYTFSLYLDISTIHESL